LGACTLCFAFKIRHLPDRCRSSINQGLGRPIIDRSRASSINQRSIGLSDRSLIDRWSMVDRCRSHRPADRWLSLLDSTPFRKHGRKAYVRGYMHGFCNKANMFDPDACPSTLEFVPFIEIMEITWALSDT